METVEKYLTELKRATFTAGGEDRYSAKIKTIKELQSFISRIPPDTVIQTGKKGGTVLMTFIDKTHTGGKSIVGITQVK